MRLLLSAAFALLLAGPLAAQTTPEPPAAPAVQPTGIIVLGPELLPPSPVPGANPIFCVAGRFIPISPADGSPSYIADCPGYRVYRVTAGERFTGIKFDAAPDAEPEAYSWPTAKGPVYCLLARNVPGRYSVQLVKNGREETGPVANGAPIMVEVGVGPRPPPGPTPVPPGPTPVPPGPTPGPAPIPGPGLHALFLFESSTLSKLPPAQEAALYAKSIRDYMRSKNIDSRFYDPDVDLTGEVQLWKDAIKRPRTSLPWVIISDGVKGYEGPMPANIADTLALLKQFGG